MAQPDPRFYGILWMEPFLVHFKGGGAYFYYDVVSMDIPTASR
jgi:hypothetical protein